MSDPDSTEGMARTTEQIANAGSGGPSVATPTGQYGLAHAPPRGPAGH
jgi:hypothetical protein